MQCMLSMGPKAQACSIWTVEYYIMSQLPWLAMHPVYYCDIKTIEDQLTHNRVPVRGFNEFWDFPLATLMLLL